MSEWKAAARQWLSEDPDPATREELRAILTAGDEAQLSERFGARLEFGTAGLRGLLGAGPNRMNRAVVIRTTAGLAAYLLEHLPECTHRGVALGHDARRMSREFARDVAAVLAGAGIPVFAFGALATTPLVAFAVRELNAVGGVMITASHNPPEYNGYKVYWENGAQIVPPQDKGIAAAIAAVGPLASVALLPESVARNRRLLRPMPERVTEAYFKGVEALCLPVNGEPSVGVVYTPLHGVGGASVQRALGGVCRLSVVPEQAEPDGDFPTVRFPNPEEPGALDLALALARASEADVVLANDPDADRLAVALRHDGAWRQLSGNEVGVLLGHHLLTRSPGGGAERLVLTTIVSSPMLGVIARSLGVRYEETLTGFKWIANRAMELEQSNGARFVFGYEEALGYTAGTLVRDKDGVSTARLMVELVGRLKAQGRTLVDQLEALYRQYGYWVSQQHSVTLTGGDGMRRSADTMAGLRRRPPRSIGGSRVHAVRDYLRGVRTDMNEKTEKLSLPSSDVLSFELSGGSRVILRPSGTEPKLKYYFDLCEPLDARESFETGLQRARGRLRELMDDTLATAEATLRG
ncbi:MAG: phospho-sugar mutase [Deltaproteobacteria bacterium]|nr:phospho-sugar mutase [Deltaproteobacteria bacterium]